MIIVLAGTSEGRELCGWLQAGGYQVLASVTSNWGGELLQHQGLSDIDILQGDLDQAGLLELIKINQAALIIDATHPFAAAISRAAMGAARQAEIEYLRLERPAAVLPAHPLVLPITALEQLEAHLGAGMRVFSTLGSKQLAAIIPLIARQGAELVARVLPSSAVLRNCEDLGLKPNQLVALHGPFSLELNREMFSHYQADLVLSKESGGPGGLDTKVGAALQLGIPILVWSRPNLDYPSCFDSSQAVMEYINRQARDRR